MVFIVGWLKTELVHLKVSEYYMLRRV